ncbi:hypothetical protein Tco_0388902 [Tanacetum coccineum]
MPPRRLKKKYINRLVEKHVAIAIEEYEKSRANLDSAGSSGGNLGNAGGTMNVQGCSYKTFMNGKPHSFNGTEGVVGLRRWIEKMEQANPRLYDIGCYNDNLALMLAPESDETIRLAQESRSKLSDLIRPFNYNKLNNLYDVFVAQREKSPGQRYFLER